MPVGSRVLYISLNGVREPLVQSQVVAYLRRLHERGHRFVLLTFEPVPLSLDEERQIRERLAGEGIQWLWLRRTRSMGPVSIVLDVLKGYFRSRRIANAELIELVHARSFVPAVIASLLKLTDQIPYINDTRGFWVDEKVYKGSLKSSGPAYFLGKVLEGQALRKSDAIVMLSDRGRQALGQFDCFRGHPQPQTVVIPTCVDVDRYDARSEAHGGSLVFGYVGSLSPEYLPEKVVEYFSVVRDHFFGATLRLLTRSEAEPLWKLVDALGVPRSAVEIRPVTPEDIPFETSAFDVGLCFIRPHFSKLASCPTKVGEYLAAGVPVVSNAGIGDLDQLLAQGDVGLLLSDLTRATMVSSMPLLKKHLSRPGLRSACREVAEMHFSIERGVAAYHGLYQRVVGHD